MFDLKVRSSRATRCRHLDFEGRQGEALVRCRGCGRAGARRRPRWHGHEKDAEGDEAGAVDVEDTAFALSAALAAATLAVGTGRGDVTLEHREATVGATDKGYLSCRTAVPARRRSSFAYRSRWRDAVKPMPKAAEFAAIKANMTPPTAFTRQAQRGVKKVVGSGGKLPDEFYDELSSRFLLTVCKPKTTLYFPVVQE